VLCWYQPWSCWCRYEYDFLLVAPRMNSFLTKCHYFCKRPCWNYSCFIIIIIIIKHIYRAHFRGMPQMRSLSLPQYIRHISSTDVFSKNVKSFLFSCAFWLMFLIFLLCFMFLFSLVRHPCYVLFHLQCLNLDLVDWLIDWLMMHNICRDIFHCYFKTYCFQQAFKSI